MGTFWNCLDKQVEVVEENENNYVTLDSENQIIPEEGDKPKK
jgi:hypothetical protein